MEAVIKRLGPIEGILERMNTLEDSIYTTKNVFTFKEACVYIGVSESLLYKLTANKVIPHYKPRGKKIYFSKKDLDDWLLQNYEPAADEAIHLATEISATQPLKNHNQYGRRKKN